jgi:hypothetical protein
VEIFLEGGQDLKEGQSLPIQKLQSELEVLQSLPELKDQPIEDGQTIFPLRVRDEVGRRVRTVLGISKKGWRP